MLISSMDQLNYHSMPKESYLEIDTSFNGYSMGQQSLGGLVSEEGSPTYMNEENSPKNGTKSSLYKTELCKRFSEFGSCRYGAKCQFAHGIGELRHVIRHPKYKTTKCKSYWGSGHCPYGSRCRFIHEETEGVVPPFSPPGAMNGMGGMFFQENTTNDMLGGSSPSSGNNYLYGSVATGNSNSYQKDYSLLSSFNQDAVAAMPWGSAPSRPQQSPLGYANTSVGVAPPAPVGANRSAGYAGLQDAIDALMRFSLSPAEAEAQLRASGVIGPAPIATSGPTPVATATPTVANSGGAPLGTITTTPVESRSVSAGANGASASSANQDTSADELWNDFPSLSTTSSVGGFGKKQWPTGLSLSLEGTGLFTSSNSTATTTSPSETNANTVDTTTASQPTTPSEKDETSPRLSVFERFHSRS